ncbi:MAG: squalene--hopene cyclase [Gammaproteobacteria bacterium]
MSTALSEKEYNAYSPQALADSELDTAIENARQSLLAAQHEAGYWLYEFEADCTIPSEYILMMHFTDEIDARLQARLAAYIRTHQTADSGWPLYHGGEFDISCSVKAYYALKLAGYAPGTDHMAQARRAILHHGGAARGNVFTRIMLAMFEQVPWRATPFMPVELVMLPKWFPFHLSKISYWSRTVMVPLLILCSLRRTARNPRRIGIPELFTVPPRQERHYHPVRSALNRVFLYSERTARLFEPLIPGALRKHAMKKAEAWLIDRLNSTGGLGAIFPAMVNAYEALDALGYAQDHPHRVHARQALQDLIVEQGEQAYCQPCVSPVWDTALACLALCENLDPASTRAINRGLLWLRDRQLLDNPGDWRDSRPDLQGGGWPFEFQNDHYPDLDDTAAAAWAMAATDNLDYAFSISRATHWLAGMQSANGGFASFDVDNNAYYLNEIPFADHGALLDPPTADVTARCMTLLAKLVERGHDEYRQPLAKAVAYLRAEQEADGSWFGRWGTNYIYGTWAVLAAFEQAGIPNSDPTVTKAAAWLNSKQRGDGGWGEDNRSYENHVTAGEGNNSTSYQTAWALLGLIAAGEHNSDAARAGVDYLIASQKPGGGWFEPDFTCPGFPRVFYLKYHGYSHYFPLWALARYRAFMDQVAG